MTREFIFFIYGLSIMFYFMMAWFFFRKNRELLSKLVAVLMLVIGLQCVKDLFFIPFHSGELSTDWMVMTTSDMVAIPLYAFILIDLCRPGTLTWRKIVLHELSFIVPMVLFVTTHISLFYYIEVAWACIYGFGYAVWTIRTIPRYHALLKQRFSYDENINLNWLRIILGSFSVILSLWLVDCLIINLGIEAIYLMSSLVLWMFIAYFIYKHESVLEELSVDVKAEVPNDCEKELSVIGRQITLLFERDGIWLNPNLKLSDIAKAVGTNRTYVSVFFNTEAKSTFYDFVNRYRIEHACRLLENSSDSLKLIAEQSGFNSQQSFIRVFSKIKGMTPSEHRGGGKWLDHS